MRARPYEALMSLVVRSRQGKDENEEHPVEMQYVSAIAARHQSGTLSSAPPRCLEHAYLGLRARGAAESTLEDIVNHRADALPP